MTDTFVTDELDIEDYLSWEGFDYKTTSGSSGIQLNVKECPSCGNDKWKVYINAETGLGNCFACDEPFNKWKFAKAHHGGANREVFRHLVDVKKALGYKPVVKKKPVVTAEVQGDLELPLSLALPTTDGLNAIYLEERGITAEYAAYFRLRYCADGWHNYVKPDGSRGGQNCSGRIIIPVFDLDGTLKTFQARDATGESETRYIFPAQLPGTGRFLYNGQNAYLGCSEIIVNEGPFDVAAVKRVIDAYDDMKGICPVGTFGKHLSVSLDGKEDQFGKFAVLRQRGIKRVTIMWDGEHEALSEALKAAEVLWKRLGFKVFIALLPNGKDPDDCDQIEVYRAWKEATPVNAMTLTRLRMKNPYPVKDKNPVDLSLDAL